jgi:hypothetical protein
LAGFEKNPKLEIRNSKQIPMTKKINDRNKKQKPSPRRGLAFVLNFEILNFEFVSNFVLRISCFFLVPACPGYVKPTLNTVPFQNHQVIRKMKPNKIGKRLSEKVLRK